MPDALVVTSSFLPGMGGIESYLATLCADLAPRLGVLAAAERDGKPLPRDLPYPTIGYPGTMLAPTKRVLAAIVAAARELDTDRVIFGTPWPLSLLGPRLRSAGIHYSVIAHGAELLVPSAIPAIRTKLASALSGADLLFAVSDYTRGHIAALLKRCRETQPDIDLLRARVDLERFDPSAPGDEFRRTLGLGPDDRVVLTFGRLVKRKGVDRMIDALPSVIRRIPSAVYVVAGTGPEARALARRAERSDARVIFAGRVPDAEAAACYAAADVFVLPVVDRWFGLDVEGLGVVLLEAAASGVPCVTGRSGGTPEAVIHGHSGTVVDATDREGLADAVAALLGDPELAADMGRNGRAHVEAGFSGARLPGSLLDWLGR